MIMEYSSYVLLLGFLPRRLVLEPIVTTADPLMVPEIITIFGESLATAAWRAASEVTIIVEPPLPPVVPPYLA